MTDDFQCLVTQFIRARELVSCFFLVEAGREVIVR